MTTTEDLSREIILDHYQNPRNHGRLSDPTVANRGHNPLCGDEIELSLAIDSGDHIADIRFSGRGCSISQASASMMTEKVKGQGLEDVRAAIRAALTGKKISSPCVRPARAQPSLALTPRQEEIRDLLRQAMSNKMIAGVLGISEATVKNHITEIFKALNVTNRTQAAQLRVERDWHEKQAF